jgi:hypothetical protein
MRLKKYRDHPVARIFLARECFHRKTARPLPCRRGRAEARQGQINNEPPTSVESNFRGTKLPANRLNTAILVTFVLP